MAKEKIQSAEIKENSKVFHYEILGIILLVTGMFAVAKLGILGIYANLIVKVLFGDWYFVIILLMCVYGIRCILVHRRLKISNIRYLGLFLMVLALMLLSHFSVHSVVIEFDENPIVLTLKLYLSYFRVKDFDSIVGGGIIGTILFYLFLYLFSKVGVILISVILFFLSIVFEVIVHFIIVLKALKAFTMIIARIA